MLKLPDFMLAEPIGFHLPSLAAWLQRYDRITERLQTAAALRANADDPHMLSIADLVNARREYQVTSDGLALIHVNDALSRNVTKMDQMFGETHYNSLIAELGQAASDPGVRGIRLDISSPGGSAVGAPEAADAVVNARRQKPVVSHIECIGASAAYYVAAGSTGIVASRSAVCGSIGTVAMFPNISGMMAKLGLDMEIITPIGADLKASGNKFREMTDAEREFLQGRVEAINQEFTEFVKANRPGVADSSLRGQWFSGSEAMQRGLVDQVGSVDDATRALDSLCCFQRR